MKWVTRERPKIDRVACPWLIARFIDDKPEFLFVAPAEVTRVARESAAIPFDVEGVFQDDHEQLRYGFVVYDALYAWLQGARSERHTWNPQRVGPVPAIAEAQA